MLQEAGIQQYEISNFACPGYHARHNSSYWDGTPYLGAGPAAHSFDGKDRRWNISNTRRYIEAIRSGEPYYELEVLDETSSYNDYVITSLRTIAGMDLDVLAERFGEPYYSYCLRQVRPFVGDGVAVVEENHVRLTEKGLFLSDAVMEELMMVDNPE